MKGQILDFSVQTNSGIISGEDQNRYQFNGAEWRDQKSPMRGDWVDFSHDDAGNAMQIYRALQQQSSPFSTINSQLDKISDLNKSEESYNMVDWTVKVLKNYVNFEGRARRKEYWFFVLAMAIIGFILGIVEGILDTQIFGILLNLAVLLPSIAVATRRLHDTTRSGWWQLIALTIIGIIPLIIWLASETKQESNQWGPPAK